MDQVVTTILFDGQFWIALIEKSDPGGVVHIGKYTFGPEPNNNDLLAFYLSRYDGVPCFESAVMIRDKKAKRLKEQARTTSKSREAIQGLLESNAKENSKDAARRRELVARERYELKRLKKKDKRNGH